MPLLIFTRHRCVKVSDKLILLMFDRDLLAVAMHIILLTTSVSVCGILILGTIVQQALGAGMYVFTAASIVH